MTKTIPRLALHRVKQRLAGIEAVELIGRRHVGTSTLAQAIVHQLPKQKQAVYYNLEDHATLQQLANYRAEILASHRGKLVILDQVHKLPEVYSQIMVTIDKFRRVSDAKGHFLLLGSATGPLLKQRQSMAGRVAMENFTASMLWKLVASKIYHASLSTAVCRKVLLAQACNRADFGSVNMFLDW